MGTTCSSKAKPTKTPSTKNSSSSNPVKTLQRKETTAPKNESVTNTTNQNIKTQAPPLTPLMINPPPNLFLAATMSSSGRERFLRAEDSIESICQRLTENEFNEYLLKEKSISKILMELTNLPKEKLFSINQRMVESFQETYHGQLKKENEKMHGTLHKLFTEFLEIVKNNPKDQKFEDFNKSFVCFLITVHHIFKNVPNFANLNQTYFHKDCSRPVSHDKMFLEEKSYIYMKDLNQMPFWIGRGIVMSIVDNIILNCFYNQRMIHTIRDERFLETWDTENVHIFGTEADHTARYSKNYLLTPKGFNINE